MSGSKDASSLQSLKQSFGVTSAASAVTILVVICVASTAVLLFTIILVVYIWKVRRVRKWITKENGEILSGDLEQLQKPVEVGSLMFSVSFDQRESKLHAEIIEFKRLSLSRNANAVGMYASIDLFDGANGTLQRIGEQLQIPIESGTNSDILRLYCDFNIHQSLLHTALLRVQFYACDSLGQGRLIGKAELSLSMIDIELCILKVSQHECAVYMYTHNNSGVGEICIALAYLVEDKMLRITVLEVKGLKIDKFMTQSSSLKLFVHVDLFSSHQLVDSFDTKSVALSTNLYFNELFTTSLNRNQLDKAQLKCSLQILGQFGRKHVLGTVYIGGNQRYAVDENHWTEMMTHFNTTHVKWHRLQQKQQGSPPST